MISLLAFLLIKPGLDGVLHGEESEELACILLADGGCEGPGKGEDEAGKGDDK